jgi:hypothetical protein
MNRGQIEFMARDRIREFHQEAAARDLVRSAAQEHRTQVLHKFGLLVARVVVALRSHEVNASAVLAESPQDRSTRSVYSD